MKLLELLQKNQTDILYFLPEIILTVLFLSIILAGLIFKKQHWLLPTLVLVGFLLMLWSEINQIHINRKLFSDMVAISQRIVYFKFLIAICGFFALGFSVLSSEIKLLKDKQLEYWSLIVAVMLGCHLLLMSINLLMVILSIEIISVSSYILVALAPSKKTAEASLRYILFGMFASGLMLYGISLLYGFAGLANFDSPQFAISLNQIHTVPLMVGIGFFMTGILFKISAFPFQLWTPDVYQGTPAAIIAFISAATKVVGFGLLINCLPWLSVLKFGITNLNQAFAILAIITLIIGNFSALFQSNFKRMLGYSAIAHTGFLLLGFVNLGNIKVEIIYFYLLAYLPVNFLVFYLAEILSGATQSGDMKTYKGLGLKYPIFGAVMIIVALSLTGLPPVGGFMAKFLIFTFLYDNMLQTSSNLNIFLLFFGIINTVFALFYYLKVPFFMYFKNGSLNLSIKSLPLSYFYIFALCLLLFALFFKVDFFLDRLNFVFNNE